MTLPIEAMRDAPDMVANLELVDLLNGLADIMQYCLPEVYARALVRISAEATPEDARRAVGLQCDMLAARIEANGGVLEVFAGVDEDAARAVVSAALEKIGQVENRAGIRVAPDATGRYIEMTIREP